MIPNDLPSVSIDESQKPTEAELRDASLQMLFEAYRMAGSWIRYSFSDSEINLFTETREELRRFLAQRIREILPKDPAAS